MAYEMVMPYHLHMPSYFLETFTEYPCGKWTLFVFSFHAADDFFVLRAYPIRFYDFL